MDVSNNSCLESDGQSSSGIEFDIAGEILPGWKIIASYAYTDATITKENTFSVDNRLNNMPRHTASLWTTYTLQNGGLKGLGFGGGIFYIGDTHDCVCPLGNRAGDLANTFEVPSYTRVDAAVYYETGNFRAALNFKNLSNIRYFEGTQGRTEVQPGAPFTVQGTISWEF
ncbi:TonB-dependent receptor domain-containing protein [Brasilonema bromeliae]|uniref:TonB-dependent receptor domain-containing protein n=1 Tax=Brasilonema bromeliae TaxID=383615 RepID=UPI001FE8247A|nr:TonB-dependent receptor [Brasilonema bromeliae]